MVATDPKIERAEAQAQGRVVSRYLNALHAAKPKRGRQRSPERIAARIDALPQEIETAKPLQRLHLTQELLDLKAEQSRSNGSAVVDIAEAEKEFVTVAAEYADRKGISYAAWRKLGVSAVVLKNAGISQQRPKAAATV